MAGTMSGPGRGRQAFGVSMESGLDGRNNLNAIGQIEEQDASLNGVRPRWPEQYKKREFLTLRAAVSQWSPA